MIRFSQGKLFEPWQELGSKHNFPNPKFYLYPPIFALFFIPVTFFSVQVGAQVWGFVNALALISALGILVFLWKPQSVRLSLWGFTLCGLSFFSYPVLWSLELGQNSLLLFLFWVFFILALERGREIWAGISLGILIMIKLNPVLILPWLFWRRFFKTLGSCALTVFILLGLSWFMAGWGSLRDYFFEVVPLLSSGTHFYENQSLLAVLLRMNPSVDVITAPPGLVDQVSKTIYLGIIFFLLAIQLLSMFFHRSAAKNQIRFEISSWILFLGMVSPVSWSHHLVNALLVTFLILKEIFENKDRAWLGKIVFLTFCYLLWAFPVISIDWIKNYPHPLLLSHRFFAVFFLWAYVQGRLFWGSWKKRESCDSKN